MKQGNPQKKMGRVAMLVATISGMIANGGNAPIPYRGLNQRQKRKRNRQTNNF